MNLTKYEKKQLDSSTINVVGAYTFKDEKPKKYCRCRPKVRKNKWPQNCEICKKPLRI
jgi:hypothetical protein